MCKNHLERIHEILLKFHDATGAQAWLATPHIDLNDRRPLDLLLEGDTQTVVDMLEATYLGLPT